MPYCAEHKARTRRRILASARRLLEMHGFGKTSIDQVMAGCGLTRGAFYAHFRSKAQLFEEAMAEASTLEVPLDPRLAHQTTDALLASAIFAADAGSVSPEMRGAYTCAIRQLVAAAAARDRRCGLPERDAIHDVAMLIGSLTVARTVDDSELREAFLQACRASLEGAREAGATLSKEVLWSAQEPLRNCPRQ